MLSIEHKLMQIPLQKTPLEFNNMNDMFDIMTKYQHYGMCTRLLDLTTNPLVALYFACKSHGEEEYEKEGSIIKKKPNGIVYFTNSYPTQSTSREVQIISAMARYDLQKDNKIKTVLLNLKNDGIIDKQTMEKWSSKENIKEFINIIQENYMVIPTYTNERLKKQNGIFLLASMFTVNYEDNIDTGIIIKCKGNLRDEFSKNFFYIDSENKEDILKELDLYNINEATLFPELEHQLSYIRYSNQSQTEYVDEFYKFESSSSKSLLNSFIEDDEKLNNIILKTIEEKLFDLIKEDRDNISKIVQENFIVDWYTRPNVSSKIKMGVASYFAKKGKDATYSKNIANRILAIINDTLKQNISLGGV